jgi:hypothetical protein
VSSHGSRPSKYAIDFDERIYPPQPTVFVILLLCVNLTIFLFCQSPSAPLTVLIQHSTLMQIVLCFTSKLHKSRLL